MRLCAQLQSSRWDLVLHGLTQVLCILLQALWVYICCFPMTRRCCLLAWCCPHLQLFSHLTPPSGMIPETWARVVWSIWSISPLKSLIFWMVASRGLLCWSWQIANRRFSVECWKRHWFVGIIKKSLQIHLILYPYYKITVVDAPTFCLAKIFGPIMVSGMGFTLWSRI